MSSRNRSRSTLKPPSPATPEAPTPDGSTLAAVLARAGRRHPRVIDLSLGRIERLLARLGDPQDALPTVVHIAGTNGKGSTLAFLRAILEAAGFTVHRYTSPHVVRFNERILLAGREIEDGPLVDLLLECEDANGDAEITFFEFTTAAAFLAYARTPADVLLLETGLGGRFDATNVLARPALTAISPIGLDHQHYLGDTIEAIAFEKAGILKPGTPAVIGPQAEAARRVLLDRAQALGAPVSVAGKDWHITPSGDGVAFHGRSGRHTFAEPGLPGAHQLANAGLALACAEMLPDVAIPPNALATGIGNATWPARLQRLDEGRLADVLPPGSELWLDGGHNEDAGRALADWAARRSAGQPFHLIVAMLDAKDPKAFLAPFSGVVADLHAVPMNGGHAFVAPDALAKQAAALGISARPALDVEDALRRIATSGDGPQQVLICGSLYLAGEVLALNGT